MASTKTTADVIAKARELGRKDGSQAAWEAMEDGTYRPSGEGYQDWDAALVNAIGSEAAEELFGVAMNGPEWLPALRAYREAAQEAWEEAAE